MKSMHRRLILTCCIALSLPVLAQPARYPAKPVKFVVPFAPGGGSDTFARLIAQKLNESHGYSVIIENKPGAGGNLGAEAALREPADGYTLLVISGSYAGNAVVNKPTFDPIAAIQPIVQFTRETMVISVGPASMVTSLADFISEAKRKPDTIAYGSSGAGGLAHLASEYFASVAGIKMTHIPYKGTGASLVDLAGGQIQMILSGSTSVAALAKSGKVRALAVAAPARLPSMPNVPTFTEQGIRGFQPDLWHGLVAPKGVPADVIAKLNADINSVLRSPEMVARVASEDVGAVGGTPQQFGEVIRADMERWKTIVQQTGIKLN